MSPATPPRVGSQPTPRELEVLALAAQGLGDAQIARRLGIALGTVRFHNNRTRTRLAAETTTHAVALAIGAGLLPVDVATSGGAR